MGTPNEFDIAPAGGTDEAAETQQKTVDLPPELAGKTAAEIWEMAKSEQVKAENERERRERAEAIAQELALQVTHRAQIQQNLAQPETPPDRESDPEGWIEWRIKQGVDAAVKPLVGQYQRDRTVTYTNMVENAKRMVASEFPDWPVYAPEIEKFISNFSPDVLANPNAFREAYYRVKGQKMSVVEAEKRVRDQAAIETRGRVGGPVDRVEPPTISAEAKRVAEGLGIDTAPFAAFAGAGTVTVDEYLAAKQKAAGGK